MSDVKRVKVYVSYLESRKILLDLEVPEYYTKYKIGDLAYDYVEHSKIPEEVKILDEKDGLDTETIDIFDYEIEEIK